MYRRRFGLTGHPLPKDAQGKTFFDKLPGYHKLQAAFQELAEEPGLGVLSCDAGLGKSACMRNLCGQLPRPDYQVLYLCDTAVSPIDLYRTLALDIGVKPSHRRAQLWADIKRTLQHMVDERGIQPLIVIDEAQHLSDKFLADLSGFLNYAFDSRDLLTMWLVGLPPLARSLRLKIHDALAMRVAKQVQLAPLDRDTLLAMIDHGLKAVGATSNLLSDPAREILFRACRGVPRVASRLLRAALRLAHERDQNFVDDHIMEFAVDALAPAVTR